MDKREISVGMKVHWRDNRLPDLFNNGIVKEIRADGFAFVVYNCAGDWENYRDYTGARTLIEELNCGWMNKKPAG